MIFRIQNHQGGKCPDHWRQFHRTTDENFQEPDNRKSSKKPSCYNCSGDHWVSFFLIQINNTLYYKILYRMD